MSEIKESIDDEKTSKKDKWRSDIILNKAMMHSDNNRGICGLNKTLNKESFTVSFRIIEIATRPSGSPTLEIGIIDKKSIESYASSNIVSPIPAKHCGVCISSTGRLYNGFNENSAIDLDSNLTHNDLIIGEVYGCWDIDLNKYKFATIINKDDNGVLVHWNGYDSIWDTYFKENEYYMIKLSKLEYIVPFNKNDIVVVRYFYDEIKNEKIISWNVDQFYNECILDINREYKIFVYSRNFKDYNGFNCIQIID